MAAIEYQLRFVEELTGHQVAARLGITDKAASNEATIVQGLIADGFGALILMQEGRRYCPDLARILDDAARQSTTAVASSAFATSPDMYVFTAVLRQKIVNHFNDCNICDNCRTCDDKRHQLAGPYATALIPILFAAEFRDRIDEVIRRVVERAHAGHNSPSYRNSGAPAVAVAPIFRKRELSGPAGRHTRRRRTRRPLRMLGLFAAMVAVIIAAIVVVPRLLGGSHASGQPSAGQSLPAQLTSTSSQVWHLTPWTRPGGLPPAGDSQWRFLGNCAQASACTYTLQVVKFTIGPDGWYAPIGGGPSPNTLHIHNAPGGYQGTDTFQRVCLGNTRGPLMTLRNSVDIVIKDSIEASGQHVANKIAITWTFSIIYSPPADQADGCKEVTDIDTAQATLGP